MSVKLCLWEMRPRMQLYPPVLLEEELVMWFTQGCPKDFFPDSKQCSNKPGNHFLSTEHRERTALSGSSLSHRPHLLRVLHHPAASWDCRPTSKPCCIVNSKRYYLKNAISLLNMILFNPHLKADFSRQEIWVSGRSFRHLSRAWYTVSNRVGTWTQAFNSDLLQLAISYTILNIVLQKNHDISCSLLLRWDRLLSFSIPGKGRNDLQILKILKWLSLK